MTVSTRPPTRLSARQRQLLKRLREARGESTGDAGIPRRDESVPAPLSFAQQRLWFLDRLLPGDSSYVLAEAVRLEGPLSVPSLGAVLAELAARHEPLRTAFPNTVQGPVLAVAASRRPPLSLIDLTGLGEKEEAAARLAAEEARRGFDLERSPLIRGVVLRLDGAEHVLLLSLHHLIADGWSMGILVRELGALYAARVTGRPLALDPLPIRYSDFAAWQRQRLQGAALEELEASWKAALAGAPTLLELPLDHPRPAVASRRGARRAVRISAATTRRLEALARQSGTTVFVVLVAALATLLGRLSGQRDLILGAPVAGRGRPELEPLIGLFVNTLAIRADLSGRPSFSDLLASLHERVLAAQEKSELPFERLVDLLELDRTLSHDPLVQAQLVYQNLPAGEVSPAAASDGGSEALAMRPFEVRRTTAQLDLSLFLNPQGSGLAGSMEYRADLFDGTTIQRLLGLFGNLLEEVGADPTQGLEELRLLDPAQRWQLVGELNDTATDYPRPDSLDGVIRRQARQRPDAIAVVFRDEHLSYGELLRRGREIAGALRHLGVAVGDRVGVAMERCAALLPTLLGILETGAAYVPLPPDHPPERCRWVAEDAGLAAVVTQPAHLAGSPEWQVPVLVAEDSSLAVAANAADPSREGHPGRELAAYTLYTSGSTGKPKGATISHGAILNRLFWMQEALQLQPHDRVLQKTPISFDVSVWELFWPAMIGARLVFAEPSRHGDALYLGRTLTDRRITLLHFVPSMLRGFLAEAGVGTTAALACDGLRAVVCSGEALEPGLRDRLFERVDCVLHNLYGPTEAAIDVTAETCRPGDSGEITIGRPVANTSIRVLGPSLEEVPWGAPGELHIGGVQLGRGYRGRPALTATTFIPDPFSSEPGARLYRSGDRTRRSSDGRLEFLGRLDHQVKVRGFRIELGEIEAALSDHAEIDAAAVVAWDDGGSSSRLVAYLQPVGEAPGIEALRGHLAQSLPDYMVPARFVFLDRLPLNSSGKVDRKALPDPGEDRPDLDTAFVAPSGPVEEALSAIWRDALGVDEVGAEDNYFALGGDSILSLRIIAAAQDSGIDVSLQDLFQHPTVAGLAGRSREDSVDGDRLDLEPFELVHEADRDRLPEGLEDAYPLSRLQEGMFFHSEMAPDSGVYHDIFGFHLQAPFEPRALAGAVERLMARHPVLRTSFHLTGYRESLQQVHLGVEPPLTLFDLRRLGEAEAQAEVESWRLRERRRGFDWASPPLFRLVVHRTSEERFHLTLSFHHAILDGWSVASALAELFRDYRSRLRGDDPLETPSPGPLFRESIALERRALESSETRRRWEEKLESWPEPRLPRWPRELRGAAEDASSEPGSAEGGLTDRFAVLDPQRTEALQAAARALGVPLRTVLLAIHLRVLATLGGGSRVVTGTVTNGRPARQGGEEVLGLFLNTLPLALDLPGGPWRELVRATFEGERELHELRRFPIAELERMRGGEPTYEAVFNFVHFHVYEGLGEVEDVQVLAVDNFEETSFPLLTNFNLHPSLGTLQLRLTYDPALFAAPQMDLAVDHYRRALAALAADPEGPSAAVEWAAPHLRHQILGEWSGRRPAYPRDRGLFEVFEEVAGERPDAIALAEAGEGGAQVSYGALLEQARSLAGRLRADGLGRGEPVALWSDRGASAVVGMLGILAAGGAYLPLDPADPPARRALVLKQAGTRRVVALERPEAEWLNEVSAAVGRPLTVLEISGAPGAGGDEERAVERGPRDLAYLLFTSGSTGRPKGVAVPDRAVLRLARSADFVELGPEQTLLQLAPIAFDASTLEIWGALLNGGRLVVFPAGKPDLDEVGQVLVSHRISLLWLTAGLFHRWVDDRVESLGTVPQILAGGETLSPERVGKLLRAHPHCRLVNGYGPTENTTFTCCHPMWLDGGPHHGPPGEAVPIGRPIPNTTAYVVDEEGDWLAPGVPGELWTGGDGLAWGYWRAPALTAQRFVPDPFGALPGGRLYRTGDRAYFLPDGRLGFLGRDDHQVKLRGFRIELREIEAALAACPGVVSAVVLLREDVEGDRRLVGYFVPGGEALGNGAPASEESCRLFLRERLPDYMQPSVLIELAELPLSSRGKVDRGALPAPSGERPSLSTAFEAPRTATERVVARVWREVLRLDRVGRDDDLFEIGGHSLLAARIANELRGVLPIELPLRALYELPTVRSLAAAIDGGTLTVDDGQRTALPWIVEPEKRFEPFPLVEAPESYWIGRSGLFPLSNAGTNVYMQFDVQGVEGDPVRRVVRAFRELVRRHEMLRSVVLADGRQRILEEVPDIEPEDVDLVGVHGVVIGMMLTSHRQRLLAARSAADHWPRFEVVVCRVAADRFRLLLRLDAMLVDGTSRMALSEDLFRLLEDPGAVLPEPAGSYRDYAVSWEARKGLPAYAEAREYWLERLEDLPPDPELLLTQRPDATTPVSLVSRREELLPPEAWDVLKGKIAAAGLTPTVVALTAFAEVIRAWSREPAFTLGVVASNHRPDHPEMRRVLGNFNALHLLAVDGEEIPFLDRARGFHRQLTEVEEKRLFSGYEVLRARKAAGTTERGQALPVLFDSVLEYSHRSWREGQEGESGTPSGASPESPSTGLEIAEVDVAITLPMLVLMPVVMEPADGSLTSVCLAAEGVLARSVVSGILRSYSAVLERLAEDGEAWERPVADLARPPLALRLREGASRLFTRSGAPAVGHSSQGSTGGSSAASRPMSTAEEGLARAWERLLDLSPGEVGPHDDFFALGGTSLDAVRLRSLLARRYGRDILITDFLAEPTVEHLARRLRAPARGDGVEG